MPDQLIWLFVLALPIACIAWTVTHEEVFREPREYCVKQSKENRNFLLRKCFYLFTCEYCFSHYVTILFLVITRYTLLLPDWRGYLIAGFALVWVANFYMGLFALLRQAIKAEKTHIDLQEKIIDQHEKSGDEQPLLAGKRSLLGKKATRKSDHWKDI
jgi:hypothetical protein